MSFGQKFCSIDKLFFPLDHRCHGGVFCRHYPPPWSLFLGPTPPLGVQKSKKTAGRQPSRLFDFQTSFRRLLDGWGSFSPPPWKKNGDTYAGGNVLLRTGLENRRPYPGTQRGSHINIYIIQPLGQSRILEIM